MNDHVTIKVEENPNEDPIPTFSKRALPRLNLGLKIIEEENSVDSKKEKKKSKRSKAQTPPKENKGSSEASEEKNTKEKKHHYHHHHNRHHHHSKKNDGEHTPTFGHDASRPIKKTNQNTLKLEIPSTIPKTEGEMNKDENPKEIQDKKKKKENKKEKAPKIKNNDGKIHLQEEINPTTVALLNDKKALDGYTEDIMVGLNVYSYLNNKNVPMGNKIFYSGVLLTILASYIMNFWDLSLYASTTCSDKNSSFGMYINFAALFFAKLGIFNYITSEINANLQYDLKFPFLIPILTVGVLANFQLPLIIYNYHTCSIRSPLIEMNAAYFVIDSLASIIVIAFLACVLSLILPVKFNISHNTTKMIKTVLYFLSICAMLVLNILFILVSFSQANHLSLTLLTENILYWALLVAGAVVYVLNKKYGVRVFRPLDDSLDRTHDNINDQEVEVLVADAKTSPRLDVSPIFSSPEKFSAKKIIPLNFKLDSPNLNPQQTPSEKEIDSKTNSRGDSKNESRANPETSSKDCLQIHVRRKETLPEANDGHNDSAFSLPPSSSRGR